MTLDIWQLPCVDLYKLIRPLLFQLDAEKAHELSIKLLKCGLGPHAATPDMPILRTSLWGMEFSNPIGLAAGYDKQAEVTDEILQFGFGFAEIGGVTPRPQIGNPKPRLFRITEAEAIINRFGFNSVGIEEFAKRFHAWHQNPKRIRRPVGINLGKNKETTDDAADYIACLNKVGENADFVTINISSPNTAGLRDLQGRERLTQLIAAILDARTKLSRQVPVLVKIAPDLNEAQQEDIAAVALNANIQGLIVSNTTMARPDSIPERYRGEAGGLSGQPLRVPSLEILRNIYKLTQGKVPLIGVGGVKSGADAYAKIRAGASLVQLYSALVYQGPALVPRIKRELAELLQRDGFKSVADAVGADHR